MCYDLDAWPPVPPISGGAADGEDVVLTAWDGNRFAAHIAYSTRAGGPQVVILPDARGLHTFYKELALRFAEVGARALATGYSGRTAGKSRYPAPGLFGGADTSIPQTDRDRLEEQLSAAGVNHEIVGYPGATHSFFDRRNVEFADESADAWKRMLAFVGAPADKS